MCMGKKPPSFQKPVPVQEAVPADPNASAALRKKQAMMAGASTLLTGPSGISNSMNNLGGGGTLLGS